MTTIDQAIEPKAVPILKDTIDAALQAHAAVLPAPVGDSVQVPAATWTLIQAALQDAKALHDRDLSTARVTDRMSIDGEHNRDQLIEMSVPVGDGFITGAMGDVKPDQKGGPDARISWPSIGAVRPEVARTFALGIVRAADLAEAGLAQKLEQAPAANAATRKGRKTRPN